MRCLPAVTFMNPQSYDLWCNPKQVQEQSSLLFWAIISVGSRELPNLHDLFLSALHNTMILLREKLGGVKPTYWDVCGAMVWNEWLGPIKPVGECYSRARQHTDG